MASVIRSLRIVTGLAWPTNACWTFTKAKQRSVLERWRLNCSRRVWTEMEHPWYFVHLLHVISRTPWIHQSVFGLLLHMCVCVCVCFRPPTCRSCVAVALCSGFLTRHFLTKSVKSSDQSSGFLNVGGGLVGIMKIAWRKAERFQKVRWNNKESLLQGRILEQTVDTHSHGMDVSVGRFALCHLYGRDAQRPDVSDTVVANLLDHLWGHPEGSTDHSVSLRHSVLQRTTQSWNHHYEHGSFQIITQKFTKSVKDYTVIVKVWKVHSLWCHWYKPNNCYNVTVSCPATPKSASLACPSVLRRMFPALMSRWIFLMKWRYSRPFSVDFRIVAISSSVN